MRKGKIATLTTLLPLLAALIPDFVLFDWWRISGRVLDAQTAKAIPEALILAIVEGSEPRPFADNRGLSSVCIGTAVVRTSSNGEFIINERHRHAFLGNKRVYLFALTDENLGSTSLSRLPVASIHSPVRVSIPTQPLSRNRWSYSDQKIVPSASTVSEGTVSRALLQIDTVFNSGACGIEGWEYMSAAYATSLLFVANDTDRAFVRATCETLKMRAKSSSALFEHDCRRERPDSM